MRKREGKNRLLLCFRPLVLEDDSRPTTKFKFPAHSGEDHFSHDGNVSEIVKEKQSHRSLKSVMSDIFMTTKKIGSRRFRSQSLRTSCIDSSTAAAAAAAAEENKLLSKTMSDRVALRRSSIDTDEMNIFKSDSSRRCSTTTTTASSSLNSSSGSSFSSRRNGTWWQSNLNETKQVEQQQQQKMMMTNNDQFLKTSVGLSLIVLSLLVLIVWGKICAILCTSTWLVFMPGRFKEEEVDHFQILNQKTNGDEEEVELFDSGVYKKRVIMEGLLDRNRTTRRL